jgi:hypothetical protein
MLIVTLAISLICVFVILSSKICVGLECILPVHLYLHCSVVVFLCSLLYVQLLVVNFTRPETIWPGTSKLACWRVQL